MPVAVRAPRWRDAALAWREERAAAWHRYTADLLARLGNWIRVHVPALHEGLRPGLDEAALDSVERRLGFPLPPGLRALYGWHDGTRPTELSGDHGAYEVPGVPLYAPGGYGFVSLDEAEQHLRMLEELRQRGDFAD